MLIICCGAAEGQMEKLFTDTIWLAQRENNICVGYLLVCASCSSKKCLWTSHLAGWSAARAMSAVMRFRLTEPASNQTERRSRGGWLRPKPWPGPWPCPAGCSRVASLCCCSMYCRMLTSCTTALMPSPTAWLCRLQLATRTVPVWRGEMAHGREGVSSEKSWKSAAVTGWDVDQSVCSEFPKSHAKTLH